MTDESIFAAALELPTPEEQAACADGACDGPEQRERVQALLAAHARAGGFLDRPAVGAADDSTRTTQATPEQDDEDATALLAPPGRPDSLGRIGHYEVLEVLGRGGFGIVYRAFDDKLQRVVAVKVLAPHMAITSPARKRFLREARSAALIQHENVVRIHETGEAPLPYLVMEFVPGETLQQRIDRTGPLEVAEAVAFARQIAAGLAAAHEKGLIHRDIKPSNILTDAGPTPTAKITDFGLARAADDASLTRSGTVAGTPMYMAPEQAKGDALDHRADLFSLGSVLYAMLTGRPPFRATNTPAVLKRVAEDDPRPIREVIPEVPLWACRVVRKLHAKNPAERFQSAREVAELLADCEKQLAQRRELTDDSRIPAARRLPVAKGVAKRKAKGVPVWAWLLIALAGLFVVGCVGLPLLFFLSWMSPTLVPRTVAQKDLPHSLQGEEALVPDTEFTPLFNGKDLTGWKEFPAGRGGWKVEDGLLVGQGKPSHLFTERGDFTNFHLRIELRVRKGAKAGALGVFTHVPVEDPGVVLTPEGGGILTSLRREPVPKLYGPPDAPRPPSADREQPRVVWCEDLKGTSFLGRPVPPDEWETCEVIVDGKQVTFKMTDRGTQNTLGGPRIGKTAAGHLALQLFDDWSAVEVRKIEVKELSAVTPEVPKRTADFLPFVRGTWSRDGQIVEPKAEAARVGGQLAFDTVADGTVLRGLNVDEHAVPTSLILHKYDPATDRLSSWYFSPDGTATASDAGKYDPRTRLFTWMEKLPDGGHSTHNLTVVDANTVQARHYDTNADGKFVFEARGTFTRSHLPPVVPKVVNDAKRPAEMKVLDRLVGEWHTEQTVTDAPTGRPKRETGRVTARAVLGGRFVEEVVANDTLGVSFYSLSWYDPTAKRYRRWFFSGTGQVTELTGTWDASASTLSWESADKTKTSRWVFKGDGRTFHRTGTDGKGKVLAEVTGVSRSVEPPPKAVAPSDEKKAK